MIRHKMLRPLLVAALAAAWVGTASAAPQSIAIPAYFYPVFPDPLWAQMEESVPTVSFAVMNPASGAGAAPDANYTSQIAATRAAGVKIIGYVTSSYATQTLAAVKAEIDNYYAWYDVDGIFIDEADNNCVTQPYYSELDAYTKAKGGLGLTVINPGTTTPECFATAADVILNFEGSYMQYQSWAPLGWEAGYDASRFWHLVYATDEADMPMAVLMSQARGAGYVYVTPDMLIPNPWDSLPGPSYWATELAYVQPIDGACPAPITKPKLQVRGLDTPGDDDSMKFAGRFTLAGTPAVDPVADGLRVVIGDSGGSAADVTIAPGVYAGESGWIVGNNRWVYRDDSETPADGITKVMLKRKAGDASAHFTFRVTAPEGAFAVSAAELPLTGVLLLAPAQPTTNCATATFPGPKPTCVVTGGGSGIRCR
ncbi:MAG: spherulation-specific family 4 protein [Candidatus Binatia bacterium]